MIWDTALYNILLLMQSWITPVFSQCHTILYKSWWFAAQYHDKNICCLIFLWKQNIFWWIESSKEQHLIEIEIVCNAIKVFPVTFHQLNLSLSWINVLILLKVWCQTFYIIQYIFLMWFKFSERTPWYSIAADDCLQNKFSCIDSFVFFFYFFIAVDITSVSGADFWGPSSRPAEIF